MISFCASSQHTNPQLRHHRRSFESYFFKSFAFLHRPAEGHFQRALWVERLLHHASFRGGAQKGLQLYGHYTEIFLWVLRHVVKHDKREGRLQHVRNEVAVHDHRVLFWLHFKFWRIRCRRSSRLDDRVRYNRVPPRTVSGGVEYVWHWHCAVSAMK